MNKHKLDDEEQRIEGSADELIPVGPEERDSVERILARARKTKNINIRLSEEAWQRSALARNERGCPLRLWSRASCTSTLRGA